MGFSFSSNSCSQVSDRCGVKFAWIRMINCYSFPSKSLTTGGKMYGFMGTTRSNNLVQFFLEDADVNNTKELLDIIVESIKSAGDKFKNSVFVLVGSKHPTLMQNKKYRVPELRMSSPFVPYYARFAANSTKLHAAYIDAQMYNIKKTPEFLDELIRVQNQDSSFIF